MPPKRACGSAVRKWKEELIEAFQIHGRTEKAVEEIPLENDVPPVCKSPKVLSSKRKLELRTMKETLGSTSIVKLHQFDPHIFLHGDFVRCRIPGCNSKKPKQIPMPKAELKILKKEDLFLCSNHKKNLAESIAKLCAREVDIVTTYESKDLQGYTTIIGLLERARQPLSFSIEQEVLCINLRNYLIIVNTLLNPDDENLSAALNPVMAVFTHICQTIRSPDAVKLKEFVVLFCTVIEQILFAFGVIYSWVYLNLISNPGAAIGAGVGGLLGLAGYVGGPAFGTATAVGGAMFGSLLGRGIFKALNPQQGEDSEILRRYQEFAQAHMRAQRKALHLQADTGHPEFEPTESIVYYLFGSPLGDLDLAAVYLYFY